MIEDDSFIKVLSTYIILLFIYACFNYWFVLTCHNLLFIRYTHENSHLCPVIVIHIIFAKKKPSEEGVIVVVKTNYPELR